MLPIEITTWVLVAGEAEAKIYIHHTRDKSFTLHTTLDHPEGRARIHDLVSDHPGRYNAGSSTGSYSQDHSPKDNENTAFALKIVHLLDHARTTNQFNELIIICLPHFYGLLEKHIGTELRKTITRHIMKNYLPMKEQELAEKLFL
jgi:protein required for attachment to host cells